MSEITLSGLADNLALILTALFAFVGAMNLAAPGFVRRSYQRWGYPRGFHYVAGGAQGLTALFLALPETRIWGGILGATILFIVTVSLLNHRKYAYAISVIMVMLTLAPAMA